MKKLFVWIIRIAVLLLLAKIVIWSWQQYQSNGRDFVDSDVPEWDRVCKVTNPDTGSCVCLHRQTGDRLALPYDECVKQARKQL